MKEEGENHSLSRASENDNDCVDARGQTQKRVLPRFTSFKPRAATKPQEDRDETSSPISGSKNLGQTGLAGAKDTSIIKRRFDPQKHGRQSSRQRSISESGGAGRLARPAPLPPTAAETKDVGYFTEDRRQDKDNTIYGTQDRYHIPKYREAGGRHLLGLPRHFKVSAELGPGRRLVLTENLDSNSTHERKSLRAGLPKGSDLLLIEPRRKVDAIVDARKDYLPLSSTGSRKRKRLDHPHSSTNGSGRQDEIDEFTSHGTAHQLAQGEEDDTLTSSSDSEHLAGPSTDLDQLSSARERQLHLSRLVNDDPLNIDAWLALIKHQDSMLSEDAVTPNRAFTAAEHEGLTDIKMNIYRKALSKTNGHRHQDRLVNGLMAEGAKIWDTEKQAKEWKAAVTNYPKSLGLWVRYLTFQHSNFVTFTYERCRATFRECLDILSTRPPSGVSGNLRIYLFLWLTSFTHMAGYSEHAHGLWQAILEYCLMKPRKDIEVDNVFSFEDFWDREIPRLGEEGARGWRASTQLDADLKRDPFPETVPNQASFESWSVHERQKMTASVLPARILDDVAEEDPYRVVLFQDIQPFLFELPSEEARQRLLEAFLNFCDLPSLYSCDFNQHIRPGDPFCYNFFLNPCHRSLDSWVTLSKDDSLFGFPMDAFTIDTTTLFARRGQWFTAWASLQRSTSNEPRIGWIRQSLRQLLSALPDYEQLAEYVVAFEMQIDVKEARKYTKNFLKQRPSFRLYNSFALVERNMGKMHTAEHVWSTAISMRLSFSKASQRELILVWRSWLWALLEDGDFSKALRLCLAVPEEKVVLEDLAESGIAYLEANPTARLRALQYLTSRLGQHLSLGEANLSYHYLDVLSLLTYLSSDRALEPCLAHFAMASCHPTIAQSPSVLSLVHQSRTRLLHLHATTSPFGFRSSDITAPLAESIGLFPDNTIFLSVYHFHTRRSQLIDRIRTVIPTLTAPASPVQPSTTSDELSSDLGSIISPVFQIYTELNRPQFAGSTSHSIRAAFEKAVSSTFSSNNYSSLPGHHSPSVWKLYLLWELRIASPSLPVSSPPPSHQRDTKDGTKRAIEILHRAIHACPWAKELYMLAFETSQLREAMGDVELRALYETMIEKDLRVHVELEGV